VEDEQIAISVLFNGIVYSIPETGEESWGENLTTYFVAIPQGALQKTGGSFTLSADVNFGASFGLLSRYFSTRTASPSTAGLVRLAVADSIGWRNNANSANLLLAVNGSDQLTFNGSAVYPGGITALTGDVTATGPGSVAATISNNAVTDAKFRQSAALSVVGNATNSTANVSDISAGTDHFVLVRAGTSLSFALLLNSNIDPAAAIAYSKLALTGSIVNADISVSAAIAYSKLALTGSIVNADISVSAAIAYSKLSLSNSIVNADVNASAAIAYSKLNLTGSIVNADINASAAIAYSKLSLTGSIVNADIGAAAAIDFSKLATLSSANILVGSAGNVATSVAVTGDVTVSNAGVTAIGANKVTLAMLAQISTANFLGRTTASTGNVESLTATQATALLNAMVGDSGSGGTKGLAPAPASGDAAAGKFLKANGVWTVPPGTGTVTSVAMTVPTFLSIAGSPVTTSGTLTVTLSGTALPIANGGTGQVTAAAAMSALSPITTTGDMIYSSSGTTNSRLAIGAANQVLQSIGGVPAWATVNAGSKNYIQYNNFSNNATTGWGLGTATLTSALPTGAPTFGSGASGNLTLSTTASGTLSPPYSLSLASSAATTAGNFIASDAITLDVEDQAKVMAFKFYYSPTVNPTNANWSGTSSNSFGVAIYDVTNSAWIIPAGVFNLVQGSGVGIAQGTFQTPSNMTSFRLVIYNANATSNSITLLYDDFYVGPQALAFGPAMSDWVAYTPTFTGFGTVNTSTFYSRRVGDSLEIHGKWTCGTPTGVAAAITLGYNGTNANVSTDSTKISSVTAVGSAAQTFASTTSFNVVPLASAGATSINFGYQSSTTPSITVANGSAFANASDVLSVHALVPISGWSSNTVMSQDSNTRVVAARYVSGSTQSVSSGTTMTYGTQVYDTHGAYSGSTYTAPVSGFYRITAAVGFGGVTTSGLSISIKKNGTAILVSQSPVGAATNVQGVCTGEVQLTSGDAITVSAAQNSSAQNYDTTANYTYFNISILTGPAVVAASESVNASYTSTSVASAGTGTPIVFGTKVYDSHSAFSSGTTYTAPITGKYSVKAQSFVSGGFTIRLYKNGSFLMQGSGTTAANMIIHDVSLLAGETVDIRPDSTVTMANNATIAFFDIARIGN
jgi:hypothetical protein